MGRGTAAQVVDIPLFSTRRKTFSTIIALLCLSISYFTILNGPKLSKKSIKEEHAETTSYHDTKQVRVNDSIGSISGGANGENEGGQQQQNDSSSTSSTSPPSSNISTPATTIAAITSSQLHIKQDAVDDANNKKLDSTSINSKNTSSSTTMATTTLLAAMETGNSSSLDTSKVCNVSSTIDHVNITNFTSDALVSDISMLMIYDTIPLLVRGPQTNSNNSTSSLQQQQRQQDQKPFATCQLIGYRFMDHFPHFMQQLFRCWSFWQHHPHKQPILVSSYPQNNRHWRAAMRKEFTVGMLRVLPKIGVTFLPLEDLAEYQTNVTNMAATTEVVNPRVQQNDNNDDSMESVSAHPKGPMLKPDENHFQSVSSPKDMNALRDQIYTLLSLDQNERSPATSSTTGMMMPRIVMFNRKKDRRILNSKEIRDDLKSYLKLDYDIPEIYFDRTSFEDQVSTLSKIDIFITPHGAQLTGIPFLPDCSSVLEFMPENYYYPKFFGTLAATCGVQHSFLYVANNTSERLHLLRARAQNFCLPSSRVREAMTLLVEQWQNCVVQSNSHAIL